MIGSKWARAPKTWNGEEDNRAFKESVCASVCVCVCARARVHAQSDGDCGMAVQQAIL